MPKNKQHLFSYLLLGALALGSCKKDNPSVELEAPFVADVATKEMHKARFAAILSKVVYERGDVRAFLKKEALTQFDGKSFRDVLLAYASEIAVK